MKSKKNCAIILPTYNQYELTKKNILLLEKQSFVPDIIVVDNNSDDGTSTKLKNQFKKITILSLKENTGSSGGQYWGGKFAFEKGYKIIIFSDNDAYPVSINLIEKLIKEVNSDKRIGFVVPRNNFFNKNYSLKKERIGGYAFHFLTVKRSIIKKIGYPDKNYFLQVDDADYTSRIIRGGYYGIKLNNICFFHPSKPISNISPFFVYYTLRNTAYFISKNLKKFKLKKAIFRLLVKASIIYSFANLSENLDLKRAVNYGLKDFVKKKMGRNDSIKSFKLNNVLEVKTNSRSLIKPSKIYKALFFKKKVLIKGGDISYEISSKRRFRKFYYLKNLINFQIKYFQLYFK